MDKCKVEWCNNKPNTSGKGHCRTHYDQIRKYGYILETRSRYCENEIPVYDEYAEIVLVDSKNNEVARALIDIENIDICKMHRWSLKDNGYVRTVIDRKTVHLHQYLLRDKKFSNFEVDHINRNKLDNRISNLRFCDKCQNAWNKPEKGNSVGFRGLGIRNDINKKYYARINIRGKRIALGYFYTKEEAIIARRNAELKYQGEYALRE